MNFFPVHPYDAKDRPWVIRLLRILGFALMLPCVVLGVVFLSPILAGILASMLGLDYNGAAFFAMIFGGIGGLLGGLIVTVPYWGLALLLDDIHAIRLQTSGYASVDGCQQVRP